MLGVLDYPQVQVLQLLLRQFLGYNFEGCPYLGPQSRRQKLPIRNHVLAILIVESHGLKKSKKEFFIYSSSYKFALYET